MEQVQNTTTKSFAHGINNINLITDVKGFCTGNDASYVGALIYADNTNIYIESDEDISDFTFYVVLEYTKQSEQNNQNEYKGGSTWLIFIR